MTKHDSIQTVAFTLPHDSKFRRPELQVMVFPESWKEPLAHLQSQLRNRPGEVNTPRIQGLNDVLRGLVPGLFSAPEALKEQWGFRAPGQDPVQAPWLVAKHELDIDQIWHMVKGWLSGTYGQCEDYAAVRANMSIEDLVWEPRTFDLIKDVAPNGTVRMDGLAFSLLPALIAQELIDRDMVIPPQNEKRRLLRVPQDKGTELISWPPCYMSDQKKQRWPYSYTLHITVQTMPGDAEPRIHIHYGIRRWVNNVRPLLKNDVLFMSKNASTVMMHLKRTMLDNSDIARTMVVGKIRAKYDRETKHRHPEWVGNIDSVAKGNEIMLPTPEEILSDPERWIEGRDGIEAGITYSVTPRFHPIKTGFGLDVHENLTRIVTSVMGDDLQLVPPHTRCDRDKTKAHDLQKDLLDISVEQRQRGMVESVGKDVVVDIIWQTEPVRDMMFERTVALLTRMRQDDKDMVCGTGDETPDQHGEHHSGESSAWESLYEDGDTELDTSSYGLDTTAPQQVHVGWETMHEAPSEEDVFGYEDQGAEGEKQYVGKPKPKKRTVRPDEAPPEYIIQLADGGTLTIRTRAAGSITAALPKVDPAKDNGFEDWLHVSEARRRDIVAALSDLPVGKDQPALALAEIVDFTKPKMRKAFRRRDPKVAARIGLAYTGRVSQFITANAPEQDNLSSLHNRCDKAVRDGFRQLGYLPTPIGFTFKKDTSIPENLVVAAVWVLRLNDSTTAVRKPLQLPVVVVMHSTKPGVWAWVPGTGKGLMPYRQALLEIVRLDPTSIPKRNHKLDIGLISQFLEQDLPKEFPGDDIVVLAVAQNARLTWTGLQNELPLDDRLQYDRYGPNIPVKDLPGKMRLIRLRDNTENETPEYYVHESEPGSSSQGVWQGPGGGRIYYNSGTRPKSASSANKGGHRGKDTNLGEHYAIPSLLEIIPAVLQEGDDPLLWALAVREWRKMSILLATDTTLYPLPTVYASKMAEYLKAVGPWALRDENYWDEEEDVWGDDVMTVRDKVMSDGSKQLSMFA